MDESVHRSTDAPGPPLLHVARPRLDTFFDAVPQTPVSVVVAPAGTGKTAAAAAWAEQMACAGRPVTWLRGNQADGFADDLSGHLASSAVLVIDDAHLLGSDAVAPLAAVLTEDAASVRVLLLSRREVEFLPVAATLAGQVRGLPHAELDFTDAEATELVRAHHPQAAPEEVTSVLCQSRGWAAALVFGARSLQAHGAGADPRSALAATRQPLLDYLQREVLDALPADLDRVLVATCQEPELTADEAALLSGVPRAGELLDLAAGTGLLVTARRAGPDGEVCWVRHPLLLDLLRRRTSPGGPDWTHAIEAHHRATAEYVDRRDAERAVHHARFTGDLDLQLRVLREFSVDLLTRRRTQVVADALAAIPVDIRSRHQELLVLHAAVLRSQSRIDAAKTATDRALAADARSLAGGRHRDVDAELAALELWQARFGWRAAGPALDRARGVLGCRHDGEVSAHELAGIAPLRAAWLTLELASFETWLGELGLAAIHVQDVAMYSGQVDLPILERAVLSNRAMIEMLTEAYQTARATAVQSLAVGRAVGAEGDMSAARAHVVVGWSSLQALRLADAESALRDFAATPREQLDPLLLVYGRLLRACVLTSHGDVEEARRLLAGRGEVPELLPRQLQRVEGLVQLLTQVAMGDLAGLEVVVHDFRAANLTAEAVLSEALVVGLGGDERRAVRMLDALLREPATMAVTVAVGAAVARIAFLDRIGSVSSTEAALGLVPDLLSRATPQRMLWMLTIGSMISPGFVDLVATHAETPGCHPFAAEAAAALRDHPRPYPDLTPHRPSSPGSTADEPALLTPREQEVLGQLALGGGNAELARSLFVSENTVKTHLASIYRKLGVDRRVDALRVARSRDLL
ncbi:LuxR C-terminal-related transcriptional regulator [Nocardioides caricicola]|uniref:LuxR C-terminal-related transcriptional regulator n=1 Tax=Nocardioides caricicola TaxID=634770 RepID=A0ABW0MVM6_9ACTN